MRINLTILLGFLLLSCSNPTAVESPYESVELLQESSSENLGQNLPIGGTAIIGGEVIELEIAQTSRQQRVGLMYRTSLADNRGMLFPFTQPIFARFWMKNVVIDLDMIFLHKGEIKAIEANVPPCQSDPCPTYGPGTKVDQVLELRGGRAAELGLKEGDRITIKYLETR